MFKTASLKLGACYESFKNFAQCKGYSLILQLGQGTRDRKGTAGQETKNPPLNYLALQGKENSSHSRLWALYYVSPLHVTPKHP